MRVMRFTATGIWRGGPNVINNVITGARWSPRTLTNPLTSTTFTGYSWVNQSASNNTFTVTNPTGFEYLDTSGTPVATADLQRKYKGLMQVLTNSFRSRLGYQSSYV